ncbi:hypothetical protein P43SY_005070 [Pythium insidiosum]|uniref:VASt domain-containing protein n=1 Tax=Pythium insidiosum TaxID=114742 RepID=A0AAD5Q4L9_PYTIN|nr:hypothetical protein P43SY_005070 [Pythium insidiosum]
MPSEDDDRLVLESRLELYDVPFGDCFTVETSFVVERDTSSGRLLARARIGIPFSKSTMFKGKITVALEEIFENQRVSIFGKWGPNHLLPTDRARFTNRNGDVSLSFEQIVLPPNWVWTSPWKIDKSYTECDEEGWSYATDFPRFKSHLARGKSSNKRLGASVRRRRWIRMMAYVPQDGTGNTSNGTSRSSSPSRASLTS